MSYYLVLRELVRIACRLITDTQGVLSTAIKERNGSGMNIFTCLRIEYGVFQSEVLCPLLLVIAGMGVVDAVLRAQVGVA